MIVKTDGSFAALIKSVPTELATSGCSGQDCLAKYFRNQRGRRVGRFWDDAACGARQASHGRIRTVYTPVYRGPIPRPR